MYQYEKNTLSRAKELRKNQTPQEKHIWYDYLSKYKIRFQKQKPIDNYILDFYCAKAKLAIEIDGSQHLRNDNFEYDQRRTGWLEKYGILVLRFSNHEVDNEFFKVCRKIDDAVNKRIVGLNN